MQHRSTERGSLRLFLGCFAICASATLQLSAAEPAQTPAADMPPAEAAPPTDRAELVAAITKFYGQGPTQADIVPPDVTVVEEVDMGDHVRRTLSYLVEKDERVKGYLLLPKPLPTAADPRPLVLCPHPTNRVGKDCVIGIYPAPPADEEEAHKRETRQYALDLVREGFICFAPDRAGYGERAPLENEPGYQAQTKAYSDEFRKRWPKWGFTAGKPAWDLQRALDFLLEYDFIDSQRVASIGHSLGAWDTMFIASVDERVKVAVVNSGGLSHFETPLWEDAQARQALVDKPANLVRMANLMLMAIAPRPFLDLRAINDPYERGKPNLLEGYRLVFDYYRQAAGKTRTWNAPVAIYFHGSGHSFESDAQALAYEWLRKHLDMNPPEGGST